MEEARAATPQTRHPAGSPDAPDPLVWRACPRDCAPLVPLAGVFRQFVAWGPHVWRRGFVIITDSSSSLFSYRPSMSVPVTRFPLASDSIAAVAGELLREAKAAGATAAETEVSQGFGQSVTVRKGDVETIAYNRDKGIGVTVYVGARRGNASHADFDPGAIKDTVTKALTIARYTADDACAGLADPALLAHDWTDPDLSHPWPLTVEQAIELGRACEAAARGVDAGISNSEGAS